MGIETSADHGGSESSFTSAIITIEELAKVDPSVSVLCDVHNTLVNTVLRKYATEKQKEKWLPQLSESKVLLWFHCVHASNPCSLAPSVYPKRRQVQTPLLCRPARRSLATTTSSTDPRCGSLILMKLRSSLCLRT